MEQKKNEVIETKTDIIKYIRLNKKIFVWKINKNMFYSLH